MSQLPPDIYNPVRKIPIQSTVAERNLAGGRAKAAMGTAPKVMSGKKRQSKRFRSS